MLLKELGSELRWQFLGDSSAEPQNDVEFFMVSSLRSERQTSFLTKLKMTIDDETSSELKRQI